MVSSKLALDIIEKCSEYFTELAFLLEQLDFLVEKDVIYTEAGLIFTFECDTEFYKPLKRIDGVYGGPTILSTLLPDGADTTLIVKNGIVYCLEILSRNLLYPKEVMNNYKLVEII